jgi:hypothetical protein
MGIDASTTAKVLGREEVLVALRSYESHFVGNILEEDGCACVVSWPGAYAKSWDKVVLKSKQSKHSAAVVFLPKDTLHYGKCGSDKCYCVEVEHTEHSPLTLLLLFAPVVLPAPLPTIPFRCTARRRSGAVSGSSSGGSMLQRLSH